MTKMRKLVTLLMAALMLLPSTAAFAEETPDPFMKFDHVVEVHIGQMAYPTQAFPDGDTNEDNVFTRYLLENFNIKVVVDWSAAVGDDYNQKVNLCIASNTLPDGLQCDRKAMLAAANADMLYDLTEIFDQYASPQVKEIMSAGGGMAFEYSKVNGKQVCTVGVDVATSGRSVLNIRKDWLDMYGLEEPKTLDDIEHIAQVFLEKQPGGEGTIPIAAGSGAYNNFLAGGAAGPGFEPVFAAYDAYLATGMWARTATLLKSVVSFVLIVTSHALAYKLADYRVF